MPNTKNKYPINERVIEKMAEAGLDEMALAANTGVPKATIYRITNKQVKPNRGTLMTLAPALNTSLNYLLTGQEGTSQVGTNGNDPSVTIQMFQFLKDELVSKNALISELNQTIRALAGRPFPRPTREKSAVIRSIFQPQSRQLEAV